MSPLTPTEMPYWSPPAASEAVSLACWVHEPEPSRVKTYAEPRLPFDHWFAPMTAVSPLSATEPRYHTKIRFDQRLEEMRPPGFPMTDRYEVEFLDTSWNVESIE